MSRIVPAAAVALAMLAAPAFASNGGDRTPAGGAYMSSYSNNAYADRARQPEPAFGRGFFEPSRGDVNATGSIERRRYDYRR